MSYSEERQVKSWDYIGLFLTALATILFELLLTRIFCVTMWYHFAFMAISLAMFGMTFGSIIVHSYPRIFRVDSARKWLSISSLIFAATIVSSFAFHADNPFIKAGPWQGSLWNIVLTYLVISIPFVFSG